MSKEAMEKALECLEFYNSDADHFDGSITEVIDALRFALAAQPEYVTEAGEPPTTVKTETTGFRVVWNAQPAEPVERECPPEGHLLGLGSRAMDDLSVGGENG